MSDWCGLNQSITRTYLQHTAVTLVCLITTHSVNQNLAFHCTRQ